jgi:hypothetical protein
MESKADAIRRVYRENRDEGNAGLQNILAHEGIDVTSGYIIGVIGTQANRHADSDKHFELVDMAKAMIQRGGTYEKALSYLKIARACPTQSNRT